MAYRPKWEALANNDVRKLFALSMETKFQQLSEVSEDTEMEWSLFQTAMILSVVESCGQKWNKMAVGSKKKNTLVEQNVKEVIGAKDML